MFKQICNKHDINNIISKEDVFYAFLLGIVSFVLSDFVAYELIGKYISIFLFVSVLLFFIFNKKKGFILILILLFIFPETARNIVALRDLFNTLDVPYYTINSTKIMGIALSQHILILTSIYIVFTEKFRITNKSKYLLLISGILFVSISIATLLDILMGRDIYIRIIISDSKFFIILFIGIIYGLFLIKKFTNPIHVLVKIILYIGLANGLKTILYLIHDVTTGSYSLSFATQPYMVIPATIALLYLIKKFNLYSIMLIMLMFFGGMSISRGDIMFFFLDILLVCLIFIFQRRKILFKFKKFYRIVVFLSFIVVVPILSLYTFNEKAFNFLAYKFSFFTSEVGSSKMSSSPKVRVYEFKNIYCKGVDLGFPLIIGRGFGSYFTYDCVPVGIELGISDYSMDQLKIQKFFTPHTFVNFTFLKGGSFMLIMYIFIPLIILVYGIKLFILRRDIFIEFLGVFSILYSIFAFNMFWLPRYILFTLILIVVLLNYKLLIHKENI